MTEIRIDYWLFMIDYYRNIIVKVAQSRRDSTRIAPDAIGEKDIGVVI